MEARTFRLLNLVLSSVNTFGFKIHQVSLFFRSGLVGIIVPFHFHKAAKQLRSFRARRSTALSLGHELGRKYLKTLTLMHLYQVV